MKPFTGKLDPVPERKPFTGKLDGEPEGRTVSEVVGDTARGVLSGGIGLVKTVGDLAALSGLAAPDNAVSELAGNAQKYYTDGDPNLGATGQSEYLKEQRRQQQQAIDAEESQLGKAGAAIKTTLTNPALLGDMAAQNIASLVPALGAGRLAAGAATKLGTSAATAGKVGVQAAVGTGAVQQATDVSSGAYDAAMAQPQEVWDANPEYLKRVAAGQKPDQVKQELAMSAARAAFLPAAGVSVASQFVPGGQAVERALVGGAAKAATLGGLKGAAVGALKGAGGEALSEAIEEGGGQVAANLGAQAYTDPNRGTFDDVGQNAALGAIGGGLFGGVLGGAAGITPSAHPAANATQQALVPSPAESQPVQAQAAPVQTPMADQAEVVSAPLAQTETPPLQADSEVASAANQSVAQPVNQPQVPQGQSIEIDPNAGTLSRGLVQMASGQSVLPAAVPIPAPAQPEPGTKPPEPAIGSTKPATSPESAIGSKTLEQSPPKKAIDPGKSVDTPIGNDWRMQNESEWRTGPGFDDERALAQQLSITDQREIDRAESAPSVVPKKPTAEQKLDTAARSAIASGRIDRKLISKTLGVPISAVSEAIKRARSELTSTPPQAYDLDAAPKTAELPKNQEKDNVRQEEPVPTDASTDASINAGAESSANEQNGIEVKGQSAQEEVTAPEEVSSENGPVYDESSEVLDDDIHPPSGPFSSLANAELVARRFEGGRVVPVDGGYVIRTPVKQRAPAAPKEPEQDQNLAPVVDGGGDKAQSESQASQENAESVGSNSPYENQEEPEGQLSAQTVSADQPQQPSGRPAKAESSDSAPAIEGSAQNVQGLEGEGNQSLQPQPVQSNDDSMGGQPSPGIKTSKLGKSGAGKLKPKRIERDNPKIANVFVNAALRDKEGNRLTWSGKPEDHPGRMSAFDAIRENETLLKSYKALIKCLRASGG